MTPGEQQSPRGFFVCAGVFRIGDTLSIG